MQKNSKQGKVKLVLNVYNNRKYKEVPPFQELKEIMVLTKNSRPIDEIEREQREKLQLTILKVYLVLQCK